MTLLPLFRFPHAKSVFGLLQRSLFPVALASAPSCGADSRTAKALITPQVAVFPTTFHCFPSPCPVNTTLILGGG